MDRADRLAILDLALGLERLEAMGLDVAPIRDALKEAFETGSLEPLVRASGVLADMRDQAGAWLLESS